MTVGPVRKGKSSWYGKLQRRKFPEKRVSTVAEGAQEGQELPRMPLRRKIWNSLRIGKASYRRLKEKMRIYDKLWSEQRNHHGKKCRRSLQISNTFGPGGPILKRGVDCGIINGN